MRPNENEIICRYLLIKLLGIQLCFRRFPIDGFSDK